MLQQIFRDLTRNYTDNLQVVERLWQEIEQHYSAKGRYYHNPQHLENLYGELQHCHEQVEDFDTLLFSLFYHDVIYKPTAKDNEEKSAEKAVKRLGEIGCDINLSLKCQRQILATKSHTVSIENDTNFFTDADLSILGSNGQTYIEYSRQVRKEYSMYPDFLYNPGRKKVLQHFLDMNFIFKTYIFRNKYEDQARENLSAELDVLS